MTETVTTVDDARIGSFLRHWRRRRRMSQLDLALETGISPRHLSFLETGRSRPSAPMVLRLADQLDVPLRDRNAMLLAAGYAPAFEERPLDSPDMAPVRDALQLLMDGHDPHPALVVDRAWDVVATNRGMGLLIASVSPSLLEAPNAMRLALHPEGVAPRIVNLAEWRAHLLERLERQVALSGDERLVALLDECRAYPAPDGGAHGPTSHDIFVPLVLDDGAGGELRFFSTIATFGTAVEITTAELSIESFFPADERTAEFVRSAVG